MLLASIIGGAAGGWLVALLLDGAYRERGALERDGSPGRPLRRFFLLPVAGAAVVAVVSTTSDGLAEMAGTTAVAFTLLALAATDFERHLLPNRLVYPAIPLAVALAPWLPAGSYDSSILGAALGFVVLLVPHLALRGALGAGDVKLAALIGAFTGVGLLLPALTLGAILGAFGCLILLRQTRTRHAALAYGPYLVFGALFAPLS